MNTAKRSVGEAGPDPASDVELAHVLEAVLADVEAGRPVDVERLLADHPAVADDLGACLASLRFIEKGAGSLTCPEPGGPGSLENLGDFRIHREIGRGGMGIVYEAEQLSLGRKVALKVLPFAAALDARQLQRFKHEAHAAAHLHHQNIVPVYFVGCERGVHFYAMQYIEGQTLSALIRQLRQRAGKPDQEGEAGGAPASPQARQLADEGQMPVPAAQGLGDSTTDCGPKWQAAPAPDDIPTQAYTPASGSTEASTRHAFHFSTVANLGIQAAEALEHAHQLGVIHRDIKPSNLLLETYPPLSPAGGRGAGGKELRLWVTDFGLAHCQSQPGLTLTGDLVGTLRYMSPEQALAKRVPIDQRTDIYSLGVTLYELLTLEPAFCGDDRQALLRQIAFEEPRPPRRINRAIPRDLETIVLKAMEKNPAERYQTAQELADDLLCCLEDKPIRAKPSTLLQKARKWARRHRPVAWSAGLAAAMVLLVLVGALAVNYVLVSRERDEKQEALGQKEDALRQARQALLLKDQALKEKALALEDVRREKRRADTNLERAREAGAKFLIATASDPRLKDADLHTLRKHLLGTAVPFFEELARQREGDPKLEAERGKAYYKLAFVRTQLGEDKQALADYEQARAILGRLAKDLPASASDRELLGASHDAIGYLLRSQGRLTDAEKAFGKALALFGPLHDGSPGKPRYGLDLARVHIHLGHLLARQGKPAQAQAHCRNALDLVAKLAADFPSLPECRQALAASHDSQGLLLNGLGNRAEALRHHREAQAIQEKLVAEFPGNPGYRRELGLSHTQLGFLLVKLSKIADAERHYDQALAIQRKLADDFPTIPEYRQDLAQTLDSSSTMLLVSQRNREAELASGQALELRKKLVDQFPQILEYRYDLARTYNNLGGQLHTVGKQKEAEAALHKALALHEESPPDMSFSPPLSHAALAATLTQLAMIQMDRKDFPEARRLLQRALDHERAALKACPKEPDYREALRLQYRRLILTLKSLKEHGELAQVAEQSVRELPDNLQAYVTAWQALTLCVKLAEEDARLGNAMGKQLAQRYARRASEFLREAIQRVPDQPAAQNDLAWILANNPAAIFREPTQAVALAHKAVHGAPAEGTFWNTLGAAYYRAGQWEPAISALTESMRLRQGGDSFDWFFLAMANWQLGQKAKANQWFDQGVLWMDKNQPKNEELRRLRAEAAELLGTQTKKN
jgi:serine/threonine protein kinase/Flp pilus assembly protein TadD